MELQRVLAVKRDNLELKVSPFGVVLQKGARVTLTGLQSVAHLNGVTGTLVSDGQSNTDRWEVEVRSTLALKPENLQLIPGQKSVPAEGPPIQRGGDVRITGLQGSPEYNGLWGTVLSAKPTDGRWEVEIIYKREPKVLRLKRENMIPAEPAEPMKPEDWASEPEEGEEEGEVPVADESDPLNEEERLEGNLDHRMPAVNHEMAEYKEFPKTFYKQHSDITDMTEEEVKKLRALRGITATGDAIARPVLTWEHLGLPNTFLKVLTTQGPEEPTALQSQVIPCAMSGRDVAAVAGTGTGKTLAYLVPLCVHVSAQFPPDKREVLSYVVCATREHAMQVHRQAVELYQGLSLRVSLLVGGLDKKVQLNALRRGVEIVVCTPGRLISFTKRKVTHSRRVTLLILDEADQLLVMGYQSQATSIVKAVRPDRQTLLFTSTMPPKLWREQEIYLQRPVVVRFSKAAPLPLEEKYLIVAEEKQKLQWLLQKAKTLHPGQALVFTATTATCERLSKHLKELLGSVAHVHGDMEPAERMKAVEALRSRKVTVMVATDSAVQGLDLPLVKVVISYDPPFEESTHVERSKRADRTPGSPGTAYTLLLQEDRLAAGALAGHFREQGRNPPEDLLKVARGMPSRAAGPAGKKSKA